jgi:hypothetical protein
MGMTSDGATANPVNMPGWLIREEGSAPSARNPIFTMLGPAYRSEATPDVAAWRRHWCRAPPRSGG